MSKRLIFLLVSLFAISTVNAVSNINSDKMCQQYLSGLANNIHLAENIGMQALRVSLNRMADEQPQYFDIANEIAFGTALDEAGHQRTGSSINYQCTQDGAVLNDIAFDTLLAESIRLSKEK